MFVFSSGITVIYKLHKNKLAIAFLMNNIHHRIKAHTYKSFQIVHIITSVYLNLFLKCKLSWITLAHHIL